MRSLAQPSGARVFVWLPIVIVVGCGGESSSGTDGTPSAGGADCEWKVVEMRRVEGCDPANSRCTITSYDERGHEIGSHVDRGCDETIDGDCATHELDAMGRKVSTQTESDCDGVVTECTTYTYAPDGTVTERRDRDCDDVSPTCTSILEDAQGHELRRETDFGCDGPDSCVTATYDAQGRPLRREYGCGPTPDSCTTIEYEADMMHARTESDDGCDGTPDSCYLHVYDDDGDIVEEMGLASCTDDTVRSCNLFPQDEHGNRAGTEADHNCDGTPDECVYWKYECL